MEDQPPLLDLVLETVQEFCMEFIAAPYLCYTEHGLHALFHTRLYNKLPEEWRYMVWKEQKMCVLQKEYRTAKNLDWSRRQNWDIAVIKTPPSSRLDGPTSYDYLRLATIVEFALNEPQDHLVRDIQRVCHAEANTDSAIIVHLYRLSRPGHPVSARDWSLNSARICPNQSVAELTKNKPVRVYYAVYAPPGTYPSGVWLISGGKITELAAAASCTHGGSEGPLQ